MSQTICQQPRRHHYYTRQQAPTVEFQVPVFKNPETPGYTCCVPKPFLSLVAGNTVQEVQEAVEECVAFFVEICKEEGHSIPLALSTPYKESLNQDGFQQLLTIRIPGTCCCCHNCMLLSSARCLVLGAWLLSKGLSPYLIVSNAGLSHECLQWMVSELSLPEMLKILGANGWKSVAAKVCKNKIPMKHPNKTTT